jgi:hypothetical protein
VPWRRPGDGPLDQAASRRRSRWRGNTHAFACLRAPLPVAGVQSRPRAGHASRSLPPPETAGDCALGLRSSALQSRTVAIRRATHAENRRGLASRHDHDPPRQLLSPLLLFRFPKPFGSRRHPQLPRGASMQTDRRRTRRSSAARALHDRQSHGLPARTQWTRMETSVASTGRFRAKFFDPIMFRTRLPRPL